MTHDLPGHTEKPISDLSETGFELAFLWSRLSESNRRPVHYEPILAIAVTCAYMATSLFSCSVVSCGVVWCRVVSQDHDLHTTHDLATLDHIVRSTTRPDRDY